MRRRYPQDVWRLLPACLIGPAVLAGAACPADTVPGPDVTVSGIGLASNGVGNDFLYYGAFDPPGGPTGDTVRAYIMGATACGEDAIVAGRIQLTDGVINEMNAAGEATIGLFKPGTPAAVTVVTSVPAESTCAATRTAMDPWASPIS